MSSDPNGDPFSMHDSRGCGSFSRGHHRKFDILGQVPDYGLQSYGVFFEVLPETMRMTRAEHSADSYHVMKL